MRIQEAISLRIRIHNTASHVSDCACPVIEIYTRRLAGMNALRSGPDPVRYSKYAMLRCISFYLFPNQAFSDSQIPLQQIL